MAQCCVPGATAIIVVIPGNGMVRTHRSAFIGGLIQVEQNVDSARGVGDKVVPFIAAHPLFWQHRSRGMSAIDYMNGRLSDSGMATKEGANEVAIPEPLMLCIAGRVDANIATACMNIALKGRL